MKKPNIELFKAINFLADYLGKEPNIIVSNLAFFDKEVFAKLKDEYNDCVAFYDLSIEERASRMGFTVKKSEEGLSISTVL